MNAVFSRHDHQIDRLLNLHEVILLTALSRATVYRAIASGDFPPPVKIGRISRWPVSEISNFVAGLTTKRDTGGSLPHFSVLNEEQR